VMLKNTFDQAVILTSYGMTEWLVVCVVALVVIVDVVVSVFVVFWIVHW